ncbi:HipA domain-containing protein [Garicola koreensis]|uniref:Serine/threonine protein kinase HipA of HipAB toxin-antitoxin module n=1 Tax=Garicola koreensis TaxID=1262554 RepID=A0A7W5U1R8_9MICC|nr:HipA domain-containing protein [Garicola koreensis]MBB3667621.1 serine/threonine protein kinase HipA of HipAB toxin-antitoxin module [Garicola koreensis]
MRVDNTVIGAPDAHARNCSVILDGESVRLAPLYDVSTEPAHTKGADVTSTGSLSWPNDSKGAAS